MFDWEHGIAVHAMQWNPSSSLAEGEVSCYFSSCVGNLGYIFELQQGWPFKTRVCTATSGHLSSYDRYESKLGLAGQYGRFWM